MPERLTPEQLDALADGYARGQDRSWWPECPESFREEWKRTEDALRFAARDARTLDRVRAWTETPSDTEWCGSNTSALCHQIQAADDKREVAALLRDEDEK